MLKLKFLEEFEFGMLAQQQYSGQFTGRRPCIPISLILCSINLQIVFPNFKYISHATCSIVVFVPSEII